MGVNLPVAVLAWLIILPMMARIHFGAWHQVAKRWRGIGARFIVNWMVEPFFDRHWWRDLS
jgi:ACR3 family arsenite transporter